MYVPNLVRLSLNMFNLLSFLGGNAYKILQIFYCIRTVATVAYLQAGQNVAYNASAAQSHHKDVVLSNQCHYSARHPVVRVRRHGLSALRGHIQHPVEFQRLFPRLLPCLSHRVRRGLCPAAV